MSVRSHIRRWLVDARFAAGVAGLPPRVARFQLQARRLAWRNGDMFSLTSVTRPHDLRTDVAGLESTLGMVMPTLQEEVLKL